MPLEQFKTRDELKNAALQELRIVGTGQEAEPEDLEVAEASIESLVAQLQADGVYGVNDTDEIPLEAFDALAKLLANRIANRFGQTYSEEAKRIFEGQLRRMSSGSASYEVLEMDYF